MYSDYQQIYYPFKVGEEVLVKILADISVSIKTQEDLVNGVSYFEYYSINDGETPESIAYKYYGSTKYHHLVMIANSRYDISTDWPLTQTELESLILEKYVDPYAVHHYKDTNTGSELSRTDYTIQKYREEHEGTLPEHIVPITYLEYEVAQNEELRKIRLVKKNYAEALDREIRRLIKE